jgi:phosphopantothenoylcysteine decarboxylase/phosphopantothenate--cysteine ligase
MKCIVTAGPTYEELDDVRRLTNFSTGTLGTELANYLVERGHQVTLLRGYYSICRIEPKAQRVQVFTTTDDLGKQLKKLGTGKIDAVFHAAAVSDFTFGKIWRRDAEGKYFEIKSRKISTREGSIYAELKPTPKIIGSLRKWFPEARLIGWKYEVEGTRRRALGLGHRQVEENKTDACVVNGRAYGRGFRLIISGEAAQNLGNKTALFEGLADLVDA